MCCSHGGHASCRRRSDLSPLVAYYMHRHWTNRAPPMCHRKQPISVIFVIKRPIDSLQLLGGHDHSSRSVVGSGILSTTVCRAWTQIAAGLCQADDGDDWTLVAATLKLPAQDLSRLRAAVGSVDKLAQTSMDQAKVTLAGRAWIRLCVPTLSSSSPQQSLCV